MDRSKSRELQIKFALVFLAIYFFWHHIRLLLCHYKASITETIRDNAFNYYPGAAIGQNSKFIRCHIR